MPVKGVTNLSPGDHPRCVSCGNRFRTDLMGEVVIRTNHAFYLGPFCRDHIVDEHTDHQALQMGCLTQVQLLLDAGDEAGKLTLEVERLEGELGRANTRLQDAEDTIEERDKMLKVIDGVVVLANEKIVELERDLESAYYEAKYAANPEDE